MIDMNRINTLLALITLAPLACFAATDQNQKVEVKCYLELVGGGFSINHYHLPLLSKSNKIDTDLIHSIPVMANGSKEKRSVYEVKECVLANKKFKNKAARSAEQKQLR